MGTSYFISFLGSFSCRKPRIVLIMIKLSILISTLAILRLQKFRRGLNILPSSSKFSIRAQLVASEIKNRFDGKVSAVK